MSNKIFMLAITWTAIIFLYIMLAFLMPVHNQLTAETLASFNATANMTNFPGTYEAVASSPMWIWFIPGLVGIVTTTMALLRK